MRRRLSKEIKKLPTFVRTDQCDGCEGRIDTPCVDICPHDLMALDEDGSGTGHAKRAWNREPEQCWECYACVKVCPRHAVEVRHYADVVPLGASVQPLRGAQSITWTIRFRNGNTKRFEFPVRTTPEGSAEPYTGAGALDARIDDLSDHGTLFTRGTHRCDMSQFVHD